MRRNPLNDRQAEVLRWIAAGCPSELMQGVSYKNTARALENRRLAKVSRRGGVWGASLTADGEHYLEHNSYPEILESGTELEPSMRKPADTATRRILTRQARRIVAGTPKPPRQPPQRRQPSSRRNPTTSSTQLEPMSMRYKIIVSRVQTAERHVRAPSEAEALAKVQAELEKPYGFIGGWATIDTDMDIVEAVNPLDSAPQQINQPDGGFLLTVKAAAKYLGISYSTVYEMLNRGEIAHVVVGSRRYISRDQMTVFIDSHTQTGGNYGLRGTYR